MIAMEKATQSADLNSNKPSPQKPLGRILFRCLHIAHHLQQKFNLFNKYHISGSQMVMIESTFKPKRCRIRTADILAAGAPGATNGIGHPCQIEVYNLERREFTKSEGRMEITDVSLGRGGYRRVSEGRLLQGEDIEVKLFHEQGIERILSSNMTIEEESRRYVKCQEVAHAFAIEFTRDTRPPLIQ